VVFGKSADVNQITEEHFMYQSFYDSMRYKLNAGRQSTAQKADIAFVEAISRVPMAGGIETPKGLQQFRGKIAEAYQQAYGRIPPEYQKMLGPTSGNSRSQVTGNVLRGVPTQNEVEIYHDERPVEAENNFEPPKMGRDNSNPASNLGKSANEALGVPDFQKNPSFGHEGIPPNLIQFQDLPGFRAPSNGISRSGMDQEPLRNENGASGLGNNHHSDVLTEHKPAKEGRNVKLDFSRKNKQPSNPSNLVQPPHYQGESDNNKELNRQLRDKKEALRLEIDRLRNQERKVRESVHQKSSISTLQKTESTPDVLIEEIERKNRAFEDLQHKYSAILGQMKSKVHSNLERSYINGLSNSRMDPDFSLLGSRMSYSSVYDSSFQTKYHPPHYHTSKFLN
jgi:hypothetical protein